MNRPSNNDRRPWVTSIKSTIIRIIKKILFLEKYYIVKEDLSLPDHEAPAELPVTFSRATIADIDCLNEEHGYHNEDDREKARQAIKSGDFCYIGRLDREIVCYVWLSPSRFFIPDVIDLSIGADKIYEYKAFVVPKFRGKEILKKCFQFRTKDILESSLNRDTLLAYIHSKNTRALRAMVHKGGQKIIGTIHSLKILKWRKVFFSKEALSSIQT